MFKLFELLPKFPGKFSLLLNTGSTQVDKEVQEAGYLYNGYFWDGIAQHLLKTDAKHLACQISLDSENGMFCARSNVKTSLEKLQELMLPIISDGEELKKALQKSKSTLEKMVARDFVKIVDKKCA